MNPSKHLLIKTINHEKVDRTPIWIMRQAGRYLPEYIRTKNKAGGFMGLISCLLYTSPSQRDRG